MVMSEGSRYEHLRLTAGSNLDYASLTTTEKLMQQQSLTKSAGEVMVLRLSGAIG